MKVLIVEDNEEKSKRIKRYIESIGLRNALVETVFNSYDARKKLENIEYDLIIIDIILPPAPDRTPAKYGGIDLIHEISDRDIYRRPKYIICLTVDQEIIDEFGGIVVNNSWRIMKYDEVGDDWEDAVSHLLHHIDALESYDVSSSDFEFDVCIITALNDPELKSVLRTFDPSGWIKSDRFDLSGLCYQLETSVNGIQRRIVAVSPNKMGMVAAATCTFQALQAFKPRYICMAGICAGRRGENELGDVLFAESTWDYTSGKWKGNPPEFLPSSHQVVAGDKITSSALSFSEDRHIFDKIKSSLSHMDRPSTELRLHIGSFASGGAVIASNSVLDQILKQDRKYIGFDMEVYGVYYVASRFYQNSNSFFSMKSVTDFGDEMKSDNFRNYASNTSALVIEEFLKSRVFSKDISKKSS